MLPNDLLHPQLAGESGRWTAVIQLPCLPAPAEMFQWPKSPRSRDPGGTGLDRLQTIAKVHENSFWYIWFKYTNWTSAADRVYCLRKKQSNVGSGLIALCVMLSQHVVPGRLLWLRYAAGTCVRISEHSLTHRYTTENTMWNNHNAHRGRYTTITSNRKWVFCCI